MCAQNVLRETIINMKEQIDLGARLFIGKSHSEFMLSIKHRNCE